MTRLAALVATPLFSVWTIGLPMTLFSAVITTSCIYLVVRAVFGNVAHLVALVASIHSLPTVPGKVPHAVALVTLDVW